MNSTDDQERRVINSRYVLRGLLGKGGMADVELGYDEILDRQVAVKMLHHKYASDDSFVERFRREAQSAAALNHPNVVAVYDTGTDRGRPFIVMEYVAGRSLSEIMKQDVISPSRAAEIAAEAAEALSFAHQRGIIHRDIKPGNIMVADNGRVKVTDFGIARAVNVENVTQSSTIFGTAAYVAPEQARGQKVDGRADLYGLGCVLFEMLTGRQPFTGDSAVTLAYKHVSETPPTLRKLNPEVPVALEAVVLKAMAKKPEDRYPTGDDFANDLRRAIAGLGVHAVPAAEMPGAAQVNPNAYVTPPQPAPVEPNYPPASHMQPSPYNPNNQPMNQPQHYDEEYYEMDYEADYDQSWEREQEGTKGRYLAYALIGVLITVLVVVGGIFLKDRLTPASASKAIVPNLVNLPFQAAQNQLINAGLQPELGETIRSEEVPKNSVISTTPVAGTEVEKGSKVSLNLSEGFEQISVPNILGFTRSQAEQILAEGGFKIGEVTRETSTTIPKGLVISTNPAGGVSVNKANPVPINLVLSSGKESFEMPDVVGMTEIAARERIKNACTAEKECATVRTVIDQHKYGDGKVIETNPLKGSAIELGGTITLTVSSTERPKPTKEPVSSKPTREPVAAKPTKEPVRAPEPAATPKPKPQKPVEKPSAGLPTPAPPTPAPPVDN